MVELPARIKGHQKASANRSLRGQTGLLTSKVQPQAETQQFCGLSAVGIRT